MNSHESLLCESAQRLVSTLTQQKLRIAVAESLTGGMLAAALVTVPGASYAFSGGIVAYDLALKERLLGVDPDLLASRGAVDAEVARQMARGVRAACAVPNALGDDVPAALGVATTGVAGPSPDAHSGAPAGTVWIAVSGDHEEVVTSLGGLSGLGREEIRRETVLAALQLALRVAESPA